MKAWIDIKDKSLPIGKGVEVKFIIPLGEDKPVEYGRIVPISQDGGHSPNKKLITILGYIKGGGQRILYVDKYYISHWREYDENYKEIETSIKSRFEILDIR